MPISLREMFAAELRRIEQGDADTPASNTPKRDTAAIPGPPVTGTGRRPRQPPLVRLTHYLRTVDGRPHRMRARSKPANGRHPKRPAAGKGVEWLRYYLMKIARGPKSARSKWVEIDLNRCFNARGFSLSWGRELFRRVQRDIFFRSVVKVRFAQKRLLRDRRLKRGGNGAFVILIALRKGLLWDKEPLFDCRGAHEADQGGRHIRRKLRGGDIPPTVENSAAPAGVFGLPQKDCPAPSTISLPIGSAVAKHGAPRQFSIEPAKAGSVERGDDTQVALPQPIALLIPSLNKPASGLPQASTNATNALIPQEKNDDGLTFDGARRLMRKAVSLALEFKNRHWPGCAIAFRWDHAYSFAYDGLLDGQVDRLLLSAWDYGVRTGHADAKDGRAREREPLALAHAKRWLRERTAGSRRGRVLGMLRALAKRKLDPSAVKPARPHGGVASQVAAQIKAAVLPVTEGDVERRTLWQKVLDELKQKD